MSLSQWVTASTAGFSESVDRLTDALAGADAIVVGAGAGLSAAAGFSYEGPRFDETFSDFRSVYGIGDMYSGGFYPFPDAETTWAWWSRVIWVNRYGCPKGKPYRDLLATLKSRDFFVITTNVDHQFQRAGFPKDRLFYTQGDYGLWQCATPCHKRTYDNDRVVRAMVEAQGWRIGADGSLALSEGTVISTRVPQELVPHCPVCGGPMTMNLRTDDTFVEDAGWHGAAGRYAAFVRSHQKGRVLWLEIGVGSNTPGIIKYPFWQYAESNSGATYAQISLNEIIAPAQLAMRAILIDGDAAEVLATLAAHAARR